MGEEEEDDKDDKDDKEDEENEDEEDEEDNEEHEEERRIAKSDKRLSQHYVKHVYRTAQLIKKNPCTTVSNYYSTQGGTLLHYPFLN